ncbi:MAG TPA: hypothetical protein VJT72_07750 [Pseudonocardiaceae bacterium]|nr:hypothetical protein [Pseudonocardiaceae bacterium]
MAGRNGTNGHSPITAEQLAALKPLTAGDFYWGHKHADRLPDGSTDGTDLTVHTAHHAAVRGGLADEGDLYGFLDRVELEVLTSIFAKDLIEEESGPLAERTGT